MAANSTGDSEEGEEEDVRGYPVEVLVNSADRNNKQFICGVCSRLLKHPKQNAMCGHRFCHKCLIAHDGELCPIGPDSDDEDDDPCVLYKHDCLPDRGIERRMLQLPAQCITEDCDWNGIFAEYLQHKCEAQLPEPDTSDWPTGSQNPLLTEFYSDKQPPPLGVLNWKMSGYARLKTMAEMGMRRSVESDAFYTKSGYKLTTLIYPNGDGMSKGSHLSVFIRLWSSQKEDLSWPFLNRVKVTLYNQVNSEDNISLMFVPDPSSVSFKKPTSEKNIPSGFPLFCSLKKITQVRHGFGFEDTVYIKVEVLDS